MRRLIVYITSLLVLLISSCATGPAGRAEGPVLPEAPVITLEEPLELQEIIYASSLGTSVVTVSADGSDRTVLLESTEFPSFARGIVTAHTWSSDGEAVALAVHLRTAEGRRLEALYVGREGERELRPVFSSPNVSPFYIYWNPETEEVSFIGGDGTGALYLYVVDTVSGEAQVAHRGTSSLYWSWAEDGESLVTHTGGGLDEGQGTLRLHRRDNGTFQPTVLTMRERSGGRFQVPDVTNGGDRIAVALRNQFGSSTLAILSPQGDLLRRVADFDGAAAVSWSPNGRYLAYVEGARRFGGGVVGTLTVVDTERVDSVVRAEKPVAETVMLLQDSPSDSPSRVLSYVWSPDSSRILYYEPRYVSQGDAPLKIFMQASILNVGTGETEALGSYRPAPEFLRRILPFYDQYARSSTVWSPSGRRIVFNGLNEEGQQAIFVVDLENREQEPVEIGEGVVPLWRPEE